MSQASVTAAGGPWCSKSCRRVTPTPPPAPWGVSLCDFTSSSLAGLSPGFFFLQGHCLGAERHPPLRSPHLDLIMSAKTFYPNKVPITRDQDSNMTSRGQICPQTALVLGSRGQRQMRAAAEGQAGGQEVRAGIPHQESWLRGAAHGQGREGGEPQACSGQKPQRTANVPLLLSLLPWDHQHPHDLHPTPTQQEPGSRGGSHETLTLAHISLSQEREADGVLGNPRAGTQTPGLQAQLGAS